MLSTVGKIFSRQHTEIFLCPPAYGEGDIFMSPDLRGGWHIDFGADPIGISIGVTLSCLHNILWACGWILTKFSWTYNWNITKNCLDFGDLDLIFKVTAVEKLKIHSWGTSVISENIFCYFIPETSLTFMQIVSIGDNAHEMSNPVFWEKYHQFIVKLSYYELSYKQVQVYFLIKFFHCYE